MRESNLATNSSSNPSNIKIQPFEAKKLDHLMSIEFPPETWLVEELVPAGAITMLVGSSGSFKTWLTLELCLKVATGKPFLGHYNVTKSGILLLDKESGEHQLQRRLFSLGVSHQDINFHYKCYGDMEITPAFIRGIRDYCIKNDIRLVIFDSLVRFHHLNENDAGDMSRIYEALTILKVAQISSLILHHERKRGQNEERSSREGMLNAGRGSGDIRNSSDHYIALIRDDKDNSVKAYQLKNRFRPEAGLLFTARLEKIEDEKVQWKLLEIAKSKDALRDSLKKQLIDLVAKNPKSNQKTLHSLVTKNNLQLGQKRLLTELEALEADGVLRCEIGERGAKLWSYNEGSEGGRQNV